MRTSSTMLPKGRRKFCVSSNIHQMLWWQQLFKQHHLSSYYHYTLVLLLLLFNNISSIYGVAIKINENDINQQKSEIISVSPLQSLSSESSLSSLQHGLNTVPSSVDDSKSLMNDDYIDQLTTSNPCLVHYCPKGRECILENNTNQPICICQRHCSSRKRIICGSNGQIYRNHCRLHQASCLLNMPITYQRLEQCILQDKNNLIYKSKYLPSSFPTSSSSSSSSSSTSSSSSKSQHYKKYHHNNKHFNLANNLNSITKNINNGDDINENNYNSHNDDNNDSMMVNYREILKNINYDDDDDDESNYDNENDDTLLSEYSLSATTNHEDNDGVKDNKEEEEQKIYDINHNDMNNIKSRLNNSIKSTVTVMTTIAPNKIITTHHIDKIINEDDDSFIASSTIFDKKKLCTSQEYEIMKDNLLLFNHARRMSQANNHSKDFLVSIMFSHYDQNNDAYLEIEELNQMSVDEHLEELSNGCVLEDMLNYDDLNGDGKLSINEFYQAFSKLYSVSVVSLDKALETNHLSARVGDNVEIKCDVTGSPSPPIIWRRNDVDLSTINSDDIRVFNDGSLYLTRIQLIHSGNYTCHAQRNKDVVQTHILNVYTIPQVLVMPRIQSKRPGESAEMWCHVTGDPLPKVEWLKNEERLKLNIPDKYEIIGNGTALRMHNIQYSDTGAYMCQATNIGGTVRDISSLVIQEEPTPTVIVEERKFFVFHENGVSIYEPSACRIYHQIQGTDIIPGTQEYVCSGKKINRCSWGRAINAGTRYIYASQPKLDRILVISTIQMVVVDVVPTDKYPVELHYVPKLDQIWILNWRYENNIDSKTIQVIREAGQKRKHHTVHPEPIDGQFDLVRNLFIPSPELEQPHFSYNYGYVTHKNQRGVYKLDLANLRYTKSVDLTLYNCVPENIEFSALYGFVIMSCREPNTNRPQGQLLLDYLTDAVLSTKSSLFGIPKISPDSRNLVTIQHNPDGVVIVVEKITQNGLEFLFDVKTTLNISDLTFYESQTMHGYDLFASANDKQNILYLNLYTGKVEMITGVGLPMPMSSIQWGNPGRVIESSGLFGLYMLTTANNALFVINGKARTVNCEIGGVIHPTAIVWTHSLPNYASNQKTLSMSET